MSRRSRNLSSYLARPVSLSAASFALAYLVIDRVFLFLAIKIAARERAELEMSQGKRRVVFKPRQVMRTASRSKNCGADEGTGVIPKL